MSSERPLESKKNPSFIIEQTSQTKIEEGIPAVMDAQQMLNSTQKLETATEEKESDYEQYKMLGGMLSQEDYQHVLMGVAENVPFNPAWSRHARLMARVAGITLSPETIAMYGILRGEKPDPRKEHFSGMSDQKLLAEALRMNGDPSSLATFIEKYPHIFN